MRSLFNRLAIEREYYEAMGDGNAVALVEQAVRILAPLAKDHPSHPAVHAARMAGYQVAATAAPGPIVPTRMTREELMEKHPPLRDPDTEKPSSAASRDFPTYDRGPLFSQNNI